MIKVNPVETAVTTPAAFIVATAGVPLAHTPPAGVLVRVVVEPIQTLSGPAMVEGAACTEMTFVVEQVPAV